MGLSARLLLAPITADPDLESFAEGSLGMLYGSPPYATGLVYPPGWILLLNLVGQGSASLSSASALLPLVPSLTTLGAVAGVTGVPPGLASPLYAVVEKAPLILFDVLTGALLYQLIIERTGERSRAQLAFGLWFLNPLVILESSVHGAFDVLPVFFTLLAVYCLPRGRFVTGGLSLGLAASLKLFPLLLLPLFAASLIRYGERGSAPLLRRGTAFAVGVVGVLGLTSWPPVLAAGFADRVILESGGPFTTLSTYYGGFGPWGVLTYPGLAGIESVVQAQSVWLLPALAVLAVAVLLLLAYRFGRLPGQLTEEQLWRSAALSSAAILLAVPYVQPQYLLWVLPFLVLLTVLDRRDALVLAAMTIIASAYVLLWIAGPYYSFLPWFYLPPHVPPAAVTASLLAGFKLGSLVGSLTTVPAAFLLGYLLARHASARPTAGASA
ncbi:MAG: glycosyltransferase 87 family protein [Thermoplasmata archaeon]|nr:glycosyltransferase 87 family protein [Thermoplasmata archaeon]